MGWSTLQLMEGVGVAQAALPVVSLGLIIVDAMEACAEFSPSYMSARKGPIKCLQRVHPTDVR